ncbi:MAG: sugar ABC transporter permease [Chloroflexota bacterium]|nr:MAG: sugar ABC transporter permease [Chloroflexota bacterium]
MTATTFEATETQKPPERKLTAQLRLSQLWHGILAVGSLAGAIYIWLVLGDQMALWLKVLVTTILAAAAILSAMAVFYINRLDHRGRVISLFLNFLGFLFCFFGILHLLGAFTGLDTLADNFARSIPFLLIVTAGYLIRAFSKRYEDRPVVQQRLDFVGKIVMIAGAILFLIAAGLAGALQAVVSGYGNPAVIALTAGLVVTGLMLWNMWRQQTAEAFGATNADKEMLEGYLFLSPNLIGFLIFFAGPLLLSLYVSFTNWDAFGTADWVGLDNYAKIFNLTVARLATPDQLANEVLDVTVFDELARINVFGQSLIIGAADKLFWIALSNTLKYVILVVPLAVVPALFLANLLNSKIPGMKFFRAAYFIPSVAAVVGIALIWQWLFNATVGYINYFITVSIDFANQLFGSAIVDPQIRWTSESNTALIAVVIMAAWQMLGFNTVLFLAGLQTIPGVLYEAAEVDGASSWQKFWRITLPLLAPTTFFVLTTTLIRAMQVFEEIFILMGQYPAGPGNSTLTMVLYLYQKGFQRFEQGYASAIAWVLFGLIFLITLIQFQRQRSSDAGYEF